MSTPKQGILNLRIADVNALYNAYMPFIRGGGLFIPTTKPYNLGDEVFLLLTLMDEARLPIAGKVVWVTPTAAQGSRTAGIGLQFAATGDGETARTKIESYLAAMMKSTKTTHTM